MPMYHKFKQKVKKYLGVQEEVKSPKRKKKKEVLEPEKINRTKSTVLARKLMEYDVVSFDIFDTLILRTLNNPTDISIMTGQKFQMINYMAMRRIAELNLRDEREQKDGSREVTFDEIYSYMERYYGIDKEEGMRTEFEMELKFCIANPYMKEVFDLLLQRGKTVIITSDMYLPSDKMKILLESCGYQGYDQLFVSCDYGFNKRSGKMYQKITKDYLNGRSVIHVGDNLEADVSAAQDQGWEVWHYQDIRSLGRGYRPALMSPYVGSAYRAAVNIKLHSGAYLSEKERNKLYQYGYINGGIMILGYVLWLHEMAVKEGMDRILFIARDGAVMKEVYDRLFQDIPSEYVYLSRNAALKITWNYNKYSLLSQFVDRRCEAKDSYTTKEILESMDLEKLFDTAKEEGFDLEKKIETKEEAKEVKDFLIDHWDEVSVIYGASQKAFYNYMKPVLQGCQHVLAVDTGWRGTCPAALKQLIEKEWELDCKVTGAMLGSCNYRRNNTLPLIQNGTLRTYLFSPIENSNMARFHYKDNLIHNTCVEFITSAPHPSVHHFEPADNELGYQIKFEPPEVENYESTQMIHDGVLDFVSDYVKYYEGMDDLFHIAGGDAYWPIRFTMEKQFETEILKPFQNYAYNKYVGGLNGKRQMETFMDMYLGEEERKEELKRKEEEEK